MKTKTMVLSVFLSFFSCALFAQNQNDSVPTPKKDSVPQTNTPKTDSTKASAFFNSTHYINHTVLSNDIWALPVNENLYGNISKKKKAIALS
jgi:hypothetical protein